MVDHPSARGTSARYSMGRSPVDSTNRQGEIDALNTRDWNFANASPRSSYPQDLVRMAWRRTRPRSLRSARGRVAPGLVAARVPALPCVVRAPATGEVQHRRRVGRAALVPGLDGMPVPAVGATDVHTGLQKNNLGRWRPTERAARRHYRASGRHAMRSPAKALSHSSRVVEPIRSTVRLPFVSSTGCLKAPHSVEADIHSTEKRPAALESQSCDTPAASATRRNAVCIALATTC